MGKSPSHPIVMGLLGGEPVVARWPDGQPLQCDRKLAVVAQGMVAAGVEVSPGAPRPTSTVLRRSPP
jgi:hypothetical protein